MPILQYWTRVILKSIWIIALIVVVGLGGAAAFTLSRPAQYESNTTLLLNPAVPSSLMPYVQTQVTANLADSYSELIQTRSFGESVAKELPFTMSVEQIDEAISTELESNTLFYKIAARMESPTKSQQLLSAVLKVFLSTNNSQQNDAATNSAAMVQRLKDRITSLDSQITTYQNQINSIVSQPPSDALNSKMAQLQSQLDSVEKAQTDAIVALGQLGGDSGASDAALVIDQPQAGLPVSSHLLETLILALLAALVLGIGVAFARDYLDNSVSSPQELEQLLGVAPTATITIVDGNNGAKQGKAADRRPAVATSPAQPRNQLVTLLRPKAPEAERFRELRTNIEFSTFEHPVRTLLVTSVSPGEGKSFTASNLAVILAQDGKRVLLIDADLRRPSLHKVFGLANSAGLSTLIAGTPADVTKLMPLIEPDLPLCVMTSGPLPPNPAELLNSQRAKEAMEALARYVDIVIYDSPPIGAATDAVILGTRVDAVLLVISAGETRKDALVRVITSLQKVGVTNILPVLNRVKARDLGSYNYHYYGNYGEDAPQEQAPAAAPEVAPIVGSKPQAQAKKKVPSARNLEAAGTTVVRGKNQEA